MGEDGGGEMSDGSVAVAWAEGGSGGRSACCLRSLRDGQIGSTGTYTELLGAVVERTR
jgi:hypothetical protein